MENTNNDAQGKENTERRNSSTEYLPTKCRITRPPPPKPATNPLQFIKVKPPSSLYQKAQEQIKKVEEVKMARKEVREEAEDWQANLDNWKSSRRKRQEHIIERVVEVKKFEQEEQERCKRRAKTFNEMMEERSRGRHKFNIPIYNDEDSNDLSDYGISSSKANSSKDVDSDASLSNLDDFSSQEHTTSGNVNQSQSEDESSFIRKEYEDRTNCSKEINEKYCSKSETSTTQYSFTSKSYLSTNATESFNSKIGSNDTKNNNEKYTYEGAIEDYRSRIKSRINLDDHSFAKPQDSTKNTEITSEVQSLLPKGSLIHRKKAFVSEKPSNSNQNDDNPTTKRLSEDFANAQSIKERLQSLEKCLDQPVTNIEKSSSVSSFKARLQSFDKNMDNDNKNNNSINSSREYSQPAKMSIGNYLIQDARNQYKDTKIYKSEWKKDNQSDRSSSPDTEMYMNKLNLNNEEFDNMLYGRLPRGSENTIESYVRNSNSSVSNSSVELMAMSSDREDSGIHTADVSCAVSQADEPIEDNLSSYTIPSCIEKLNQENKKNEHTFDLVEQKPIEEKYDKEVQLYLEESSTFDKEPRFDKESRFDKEPRMLQENKQQASIKLPLHDIIKITNEFIIDARRVLDLENVQWQKQSSSFSMNKLSITTPLKDRDDDKKPIYENIDLVSEKAIYENVIPNLNKAEALPNLLPKDILAPPKMIEPPKVKPPPPPPVDMVDEVRNDQDSQMRRLNSTKRIKKEIQIKRSSFLGLDEPQSLLDADLAVDKPPNVDLFLKEEFKLEKSLFKKIQGSREGGLSEVDSQDSGLEVDRGRLSSDTWCSSYVESGLPIHHGRQDSEQTNSYTSEEEEIIKREREIIEMVEKEEQRKDKFCPIEQYKTQNPYNLPPKLSMPNNSYQATLGSEEFGRPYVPPHPKCVDHLDDRDSEVLKVENELRELEQEELERLQENLLFQENQLKKQSRYSMENIYHTNDGYPYNNYRKSMPNLQHVPIDIRKSIPDIPSYHIPTPSSVACHKSMPDIQNAYRSTLSTYRHSLPENNLLKLQPKSTPDLDYDMPPPVFRPPPPVNRQPIMPGQLIRPHPRDQRDMKMLSGLDSSKDMKRRPISAHNIHSLSAVHKPNPLPNENWIQPKLKPEVKSYDQHWLYQEAELRRLSEKNKNWNANRAPHEKHIPDAVIQTLTQRVQNKSLHNDRNQHIRDILTDVPPKDTMSHKYVSHPQTMGHALPVTCPPHMEIQDKMLSVSGKKKCSYCNTELGRGAAMIIESLCLFYHMECFKCCVCHMQLGDGLMGTDVRVRNQKLHCHNCYSSDDGVKFSCV